MTRGPDPERDPALVFVPAGWFLSALLGAAGGGNLLARTAGLALDIGHAALDELDHVLLGGSALHAIELVAVHVEQDERRGDEDTELIGLRQALGGGDVDDLELLDLRLVLFAQALDRGLHRLAERALGIVELHEVKRDLLVGRGATVASGQTERHGRHERQGEC